MLQKHPSIVSEVLPTCEKAITDKKKTPDTRANAAWCMGLMDERAVPALIKVLREDSEIRGAALRTLEELGPKARKAVPDIVRVMIDEKETRIIRMSALSALRVMLEKHPSLIAEALPICEKVLTDKKIPAKTRADVMSCLSRMDERAVPALVKVVNGDREILGAITLQELALITLQQLGPKARKAVPDIIRVMIDEKKTPNIRIRAIQALGEIGPGAQEAVPFLEKGFNNSILDSLAKNALKKITQKP